MVELYETTDDSVMVRHEVECISCAGETSEKVTGSEKAFECDDCGVKVVAENGTYTVDSGGKLDESTKEHLSLKKVL